MIVRTLHRRLCRTRRISMKTFRASFRSILGALTAAVILAAPSFGAAREIPGAAAASISQAMVAAKAGDTVIVVEGVYREQVLVKSNITLKARTGLKSIIDGKGKGPAVTLEAAPPLSGSSSPCHRRRFLAKFGKFDYRLPDYRHARKRHRLRGTAAENRRQRHCF